MVNAPKFDFKELYAVNGTWHEDDQQRIEVQGNVTMKWASATLGGYKFSHVSGNFEASYKSLESLEGLPTHVGGRLGLSGNRITNLQHCSAHVGKDLWITSLGSLTSLEGFPLHVGGTVHITWNPQLPMLRCLQAQYVEIHKPQFVTTESYEAMRACEAILHNPLWRGKGKSHMLNCALELKQAGFAENAR